MACLGLPMSSALPKSAEPPKNAFGKILGAVVIAASIAAVPFTGGLSAGVAAVASGGAAAAALSVSGGVGILAGGSVLGGTLLAASKTDGSANGEDVNVTDESKLVASSQVNQWNYKETITSTFEWETLNCHKCVRSQRCENTKNPLFGNKYCKDWGEEKETCTDTQF
jgi:hypothetical protein